MRQGFFFKFCVNSKEWYKNKVITGCVSHRSAYMPYLHHSGNIGACQERLISQFEEAGDHCLTTKMKM